MDFEPLLTPKNKLLNRLEENRKKVAEELRTKFPGEMSELVQTKLKNIISSLNFSGNRKGLAIFVSPVFEKVYYLNTNPEEKLLAQGSFRIRDIVKNKPVLRDYYLLTLNDNQGKLYFDRGITHISINNDGSLQQSLTGNHTGHTSGKDTTNLKKRSTPKTAFLRKVDQILSREFERSLLPLFVVGEKKTLETFERITRHNSYILQYIPYPNEDTPFSDLARLVWPYLTEWPKLQNEYFRKQTLEAEKAGNLISGMRDTWNYIMQGKKGVLLIEEDYLDKPFYMDYYFVAEFFPETFNRFSCIRSPMDRLIEKMLENGGEIRVLNSYGLRNFDQVAVIK